MDPITAIGLVGTIAQLVDFSSEIISKSTELYQTGASVEHSHVETTAADLEKLNTRLKQSTAASDPDLQVLCQACSKVGDQLQAALSKVAVNGKGQKWKSFRKALRSIWNKEEIRILENQLSSFRDELNLRITVGMRYVFSLMLHIISNKNNTVRKSHK
jgi:hypothetical protein